MFDDNEQPDNELQDNEQTDNEQTDNEQTAALTFLSLEGDFLENISSGLTPTNETLANDENGLLYVPILALKNMVLFPKIAAPISVGREKSSNAVSSSEEFFKKWIFVVTQRKADTEEPTQEDLYEFGVLAKIIRTIKMPDGTNTVLLQGRHRAKLTKLIDTEPCLVGNIEVIEQANAQADDELAAAILSIREVSEKIIQLSPNIPNEASSLLRNIEQPNHLLNFVSGNLNIKIAERQALLEIFEPIIQAESILKHLHRELQMLRLREGIDNKVRGNLDKQQREYLLSQQLKTIQDELGENPQQQEIDALKAKAAGKIWPADVQARFDKELAKLQRTNPAAPDYAISLNYLETLTDLPWGEYTADNFDLMQAEIDLNEEHFGMGKNQRADFGISRRAKTTQ